MNVSEIANLQYTGLDIKRDQFLSVKVCHVDVSGKIPWTFTVQRIAHLEELKRLTFNINAYCQTLSEPQCIPKKVKIPIFVRDHDIWFRGYVLQIVNDTTLKVKLVDYGTVINATKENLRPAVYELVRNTRVQAITCRLQLVDTLKEASFDFKAITSNRPNLFMKIICILEKNEALVEIHDQCMQPNTNLAQVILTKHLALPSSETPSVLPSTSSSVQPLSLVHSNPVLESNSSAVGLINYPQYMQRVPPSASLATTSTTRVSSKRVEGDSSGSEEEVWVERVIDQRHQTGVLPVMSEPTNLPQTRSRPEVLGYRRTPEKRNLEPSPDMAATNKRCYMDSEETKPKSRRRAESAGENWQHDLYNEKETKRPRLENPLGDIQVSHRQGPSQNAQRNAPGQENWGTSKPQQYVGQDDFENQKRHRPNQQSNQDVQEPTFQSRNRSSSFTGYEQNKTTPQYHTNAPDDSWDSSENKRSKMDPHVRRSSDGFQNNATPSTESWDNSSSNNQYSDNQQSGRFQNSSNYQANKKSFANNGSGSSQSGAQYQQNKSGPKFSPSNVMPMSSEDDWDKPANNNGSQSVASQYQQNKSGPKFSPSNVMPKSSKDDWDKPANNNGSQSVASQYQQNKSGPKFSPPSVMPISNDDDWDNPKPNNNVSHEQNKSGPNNFGSQSNDNGNWNSSESSSDTTSFKKPFNGGGFKKSFGNNNGKGGFGNKNSNFGGGSNNSFGGEKQFGGQRKSSFGNNNSRPRQNSWSESGNSNGGKSWGAKSTLPKFVVKSPSLIVGSTITAQIAYIVNPLDFHIQPDSTFDALVALCSEVSSFCSEEGNDITAEDLQTGNFCLAKFKDDNSWYRAKVISVSGSDVNVDFIDYGNKATVTELKTLPEKLTTLPAQAISCCLRGVTSSSGTWTPEQLDKFAGYVNDKPLQVELVGLCGLRLIQFSVVLKDGDACINCELGASPESLLPLDVLPEPVLQLDQKHNVNISWFVTPAQFHVHQQSEKTHLSILNEEIGMMECPANLETARESQLVLAPRDNIYHRATVTAVKEPKAKVYFTDIGGVAKIVSIKDLRPMPESLKLTPPLALPCRMSELGPFPPSKEWVSSTKQIDDIFRSCPTYDMEIKAKGTDGIFEVDLLKVPDGVPLSKLLVEQNQAVRPGDSAGIVLGGECRVFVVFSEGINLFHVSVASRQHDLDSLQAALQVATSDPLSSVAPNMLVAAKSAEDDIWYRGLTLSESQSHVFFVDFGNCDVAKEFRVLPENLSTPDYFSYPCRLPLAPLTSETTFSVEALQKFEDLVFDDSSTLTAKIYCKLSDGVFLVDLLVNSHQSVCDLLISQNLARSLLAPGYVSNVESESLFYVHLQEEEKQLQEIETALANLSLEPLEDVEMDDMCVAKFEDDELWYRAKILEIDEENLKKVLFIDYGNSSTASEFKKVPADLQNIQPLAKVCTFDPPIPGNEVNKVMNMLVGGDTKFQIVLPPKSDEIPLKVTFLKDGKDIIESNFDIFKFQPKIPENKKCDMVPSAVEIDETNLKYDQVPENGCEITVETSQEPTEILNPEHEKSLIETESQLNNSENISTNCDIEMKVTDQGEISELQKLPSHDQSELEKCKYDSDQEMQDIIQENSELQVETSETDDKLHVSDSNQNRTPQKKIDEEKSKLQISPVTEELKLKNSENISTYVEMDNTVQEKSEIQDPSEPVEGECDSDEEMLDFSKINVIQENGKEQEGEIKNADSLLISYSNPTAQDEKEKSEFQKLHPQLQDNSSELEEGECESDGKTQNSSQESSQQFQGENSDTVVQNTENSEFLDLPTFIGTVLEKHLSKLENLKQKLEKRPEVSSDEKSDHKTSDSASSTPKIPETLNSEIFKDLFEKDLDTSSSCLHICEDSFDSKISESQNSIPEKNSDDLEFKMNKIFHDSPSSSIMISETTTENSELIVISEPSSQFSEQSENSSIVGFPVNGDENTASTSDVK